MILAYVRVSTTDQKDGTSPEDQQKKLFAIAQLRGAGPYDFALYQDLGVSGSIKLVERPEGQRMIFDMKEGDCIIATKMDRLFRSASDALTTAENLRKRGIDLILADMGTEPVTGNGAARMFFGMLALVAEFERERINERTNDGRKAKRSKNGHLGGPPPYGFAVVGAGKEARLEPRLGEQHIVLEVKRLMDSHTPAAAAREAERLGLRTRAGNPFQIVQMQRIAQRELHVG